MEKTENEKVVKLLDILERRPDTLLPQFCEALKASGQSHVVKILMKKGLNAHAAIIILSQHENRDILCGMYLCLHQIINVYITYFHKSAYFCSIYLTFSN